MSGREDGAVAPVMLVALRLIQGFSEGGESTTSIVFMIERSLPKQRGLLGSIGTMGAFAGVMLGSAVGTLVASRMPPETLLAWAGASRSSPGSRPDWSAT